MLPLQFYKKYLSENDLFRANVGLENMDQINNVNQLAEILSHRSGDERFFQLVYPELNSSELNLIKKLIKKTTLTQYHTVDYNYVKYPTLTGLVLVVEDTGGKGVIHQSVITGLAAFLPEEYNPGDSSYLKKLSQFDQNLIKEFTRGLTLKDKIDQLPKDSLETILDNLGFKIKPELDQTESLVIHHVLSDSKEISKSLTLLPHTAINTLKKCIENDDPYFRINKGNEVLFHFCIIDKMLNNVGFIFPEVFSTLKKVDFSQVKILIKSNTEQHDYNALKVKVGLVDSHVPIEREFIIPSGLNFYELHLIIQKAMAWDNSHLARFGGDNKFIHLDEEQFGNLRHGNNELQHFYAEDILVDDILTNEVNLTYLYDFGDDWEHYVELIAYLKEDEPVYPCVTKKKGPIPVENSGGVDGLADIMAVYKDKSHTDHDEVLEWLKESNFRKSYPKKRINQELQNIL